MEFDGQAESLADLGRLIRSPNFLMPMDFFFNFFAVGEIWSAMDMSARRKNTRQSQGICHFVQLPRGYGAPLKQGASDGRFHDHNSHLSQGPFDLSRNSFPAKTSSIWVTAVEHCRIVEITHLWSFSSSHMYLTRS